MLVNNAANDHRDKVAEMDQALWDDRIAVNVRHHFFAAQAVAEMMRDAGGGSIINLGSISAHIDLMDLPGYITAKAGVEGLTRTLAREYGPWHIRVNCIIPGWIMTEKQLTEWVTPEAEESIARNQCLPDKLYPDDVARLLLWLAADDSRSCTRAAVDRGRRLDVTVVSPRVLEQQRREAAESKRLAAAEDPVQAQSLCERGNFNASFRAMRVTGLRPL